MIAFSSSTCAAGRFCWVWPSVWGRLPGAWMLAVVGASAAAMGVATVWETAATAAWETAIVALELWDFGIVGVGGNYSTGKGGRGMAVAVAVAPLLSVRMEIRVGLVSGWVGLVFLSWMIYYTILGWSWALFKMLIVFFFFYLHICFFPLVLYPYP